MSILYLVRHGQAGTRENYDSLSDLGHAQARALRDYFQSQQIRFAAVYSGSLSRQQATAYETLPDANIIADCGWDEFDLDHVYREFAPRIAENDEQFRIEYEEMQLAIAASQGAHDAPVHRRWNNCDRECVRAWVEARYEFTGESWQHFVRRIHSAFDRVIAAAHDGNVAVFTSATPIGVSAARSLEISDGRAMWLAAVLFNASFTTLRVHESEVRLFTMNATPHLSDASLRTFR